MRPLGPLELEQPEGWLGNAAVSVVRQPFWLIFLLGAILVLLSAGIHTRPKQFQFLQKFMAIRARKEA